MSTIVLNQLNICLRLPRSCESLQNPINPTNYSNNVFSICKGYSETNLIKTTN